MDRRTAYLRRVKAGLRLKHRLAAAAVLGVAGSAALVVLFEAPDLAHGDAAAGATAATSIAAAAAGAASMGVPASAPQAAPRRIYPYSVVPGGVHGRAELLRATSGDRVVAQHYAAFNVDKATLRTVDKPRAVYVSYRKGDKVYWTASKHTLAQGEAVLSDGQNEIRARCGNRISNTAQLPVEVKGPTESELDSSTEEGPVDVSYAFGQEPASGAGYQLTSFPNGAGLLVADAAAPARSGDWGGAAAPLADWRYGLTPVAVTGTGTGTEAGGAADVAHGGDGGTTVETRPVSTDSSGGTTVETQPVSGGAVETQPVSTGGGGGTTSDPGRVPAAPSTDTPATDVPPDVTVPVATETPNPADPSAPVTIPPEVLWPPTQQPVPIVSTTPEGDVPEPSSLWLSGIALAALLVLRRRS